MSCGKPHGTDCSEVLNEVWIYLDHECDSERKQLLKQHLDECGPCLELYGIEDALKQLLHRKCGGDRAPAELKQRLRDKLRSTVLEQTTVSTDGDTVEVRSTSVEITEQN
ncbi:MAG: mycothiol system anti-sigma-R factor [Sciscionella sp.]